MTFFDFLSDYFTSQSVLIALTVLVALLAVASAAFWFEKSNSARRVRFLFASFSLLMCVWAFVGLSLVLCDALTGLYRAGEDALAIRAVLGLSLIISSLIALPVAAVVTYLVPDMVSRKLESELGEPGAAVLEMSKSLSNRFEISPPRILESRSDVPEAFSVGGAGSVIVLSRAIAERLDHDELETVIAHELAHVKNRDTAVGTIVSVYRRILFFDPFTRILERAIAREKEFSADYLAARQTGKPLSLASALLKIGSSESGGGAARSLGGFSILGGRTAKAPAIQERVERLIRLADAESGA